MKKIDVLKWGMHHIGANHGFKADIVYWKPDYWGIYTGNNVPTMSDVQMLCESLGIERKRVVERGYVVEVQLPKDWPDTIGQEEYVPNPAAEMWHRYGVEIGSPLGFYAEEYDPFYERGVGNAMFFSTEEEAKAWCDQKCSRDRNGNLYYFKKVGEDWRQPFVYVCQWGSENKIFDITEEENNRYEA